LAAQWLASRGTVCSVSAEEGEVSGPVCSVMASS
jgi:hypothetical protein